MAKEYFGVRATTALTRLVKSALATKQDKITGAKGQVLGFDEDGVPVPQEAPVTGMTQDAADERYIKTDDERLSDSRTPTSHAASHGTEGDDPITPASIGAMESVSGTTDQYVGFDEDGKPVAKTFSGDVELPDHLVRAEDEELPDIELGVRADILGGHPADYYASKEYVDEKEVDLPEHLIVGEDSELPDAKVGTDADTLGGHSPDYYASKEYVDEKEVVLPDHLVRLDSSDIPDTPLPIDADTLGGQAPAYFATKERLDYFDNVMAYALYAYDGVNIKEKFAGEMDYTDPSTWIMQRLAAHDISGLHIKDFFEFETSDGYLHHAQIAGINPYLGIAGGKPSNLSWHIDFITKECYPEYRQWNKVRCNNGLPNLYVPWLTSDLKAWLNAEKSIVPNSATSSAETIQVDYTQTGLLTRIPRILRDNIINKYGLLPCRGYTTIDLTDDTTWAWCDYGKLWVPSEVEVMGSNMWGTQGHSWGTFAQYDIFRDVNMRNKRASSTGNYVGWWTLTSASGNSTSVVINTGLGAWGPYYAERTCCVPICFRIGEKQEEP